MRKLLATGAAVVGAAVVLSGCASMNQETHSNCLVTHREQLIREGSSAERRVSTSCGVFEVADNFSGGFNSYDLYARLVPGQRFDIETGGYRVGALSMFPVVLKVRPR
ncbi:hypothetical protein [Nocardia gipuzkoensis]